MHFKGSAEFMEGYGVGVGFKSSLNKYAHSNPSSVSTVFPSHTGTHSHTHTHIYAPLTREKEISWVYLCFDVLHFFFDFKK